MQPCLTAIIFPSGQFFGKPLEFEFDSLDTTAGNMAEE